MSKVKKSKTPPQSFDDVSLMDVYMKDASKTELLSREEEVAMAGRAQEGDERAREMLVKANLRFVVKVAHEYRGYKLPISDLVQEGNLGLMRAVDKFDATKGCRLISYAVFWIRAFIQDYIMRNWSLVKIGTTSTERRLFYKVRSAQFEAGFGIERGTSDVLGDLADTMNVALRDVQNLNQRVSRRDQSLDQPVRDESSMTRAELIPSEDESIEDNFMAYESATRARALVEVAAAELSEREKKILKARLLADKKQPLRELAAQFSISKERVRQIEEQIKRKIEKVVRSRGCENEFALNY